jgi:hypothetical protein
MGLSLLAGWVVISSIGMWQWEQFRPRFLSYLNIGTEIQLVGTTIATMILALYPIAAAVGADSDWRRRRALDDPSLHGRPWPVLLVVLLASAIILSLTNVQRHEWTHVDWNMRLPWLALLTSGSLLCPCYLLRIIHRGGGRGAIILGMWLLLIWVVPMIVELVVSVSAGLQVQGQEAPVNDFPGVIACISPPAAVYRILREDPGKARVGAMTEGGIAVLLMLVFHVRPRRSKEASRRIQ